MLKRSPGRTGAGKRNSPKMSPARQDLPATSQLSGPASGAIARGLAVDQEVEHVGLDRAVDDGDVLAVVERVEHGDLQRGRVGDRGLAGLEIDLHAVLAGEAFEALGQAVERVALAGEVDAAAEADPVHAADQRAEAVLDGAEHLVEAVEIGVLAVVVEHEAAGAVGDGLDDLRVGFAEPAERPGGVGEVEGARSRRPG